MMVSRDSWSVTMYRKLIFNEGTRVRGDALSKGLAVTSGSHAEARSIIHDDVHLLNYCAFAGRLLEAVSTPVHMIPAAK